MNHKQYRPSECSMSNPKERSGDSKRKDKLKQTVEQRGIQKKTVPCKSYVSRNKSILDWVIEEQPKETNFSFGFEPRNNKTTSQEKQKVKRKSKSKREKSKKKLNRSIDNQLGRSGDNARRDALNQTNKETNIGNQTVPQNNSFKGNASIIDVEFRGISDHQYEGIYLTDINNKTTSQEKQKVKRKSKSKKEKSKKKPNWSIDNQLGRSGNNARRDTLNQTIKDGSIGNQTVSHQNNFTGNESMVGVELRGINDHQYEGIYFIDIDNDTTSQETKNVKRRSKSKKVMSKKNTYRILSESDTIYTRSEIYGGAISDGHWEEIWKKYSGTREWPKICRVLGCSKDAAVGAHVRINTNQRYYILPMCNTCSFTRDNVIKVKSKSAAVPIFQRDINCMLKVNCYP